MITKSFVKIGLLTTLVCTFFSAEAGPANVSGEVIKASEELVNAGANLSVSLAELSSESIQLSADVAIAIGEPLTAAAVQLMVNTGTVISISSKIVFDGALISADTAVVLSGEVVQIAGNSLQVVGETTQIIAIFTSEQIIKLGKALSHPAKDGIKLTVETVELLATIGIDASKLVAEAGLHGTAFSLGLTKGIVEGIKYIVVNTGEHLIIYPLKELS